MSSFSVRHLYITDVGVEAILQTPTIRPALVDAAVATTYLRSEMVMPFFERQFITHCFLHDTPATFVMLKVIQNVSGLLEDTLVTVSIAIPVVTHYLTVVRGRCIKPPQLWVELVDTFRHYRYTLKSFVLNRGRFCFSSQVRLAWLWCNTSTTGANMSVLLRALELSS